MLTECFLEELVLDQDLEGLGSLGDGDDDVIKEEIKRALESGSHRLVPTPPLPTW